MTVPAPQNRAACGVCPVTQPVNMLLVNFLKTKMPDNSKLRMYRNIKREKSLFLLQEVDFQGYLPLLTVT